MDGESKIAALAISNKNGDSLNIADPTVRERERERARACVPMVCVCVCDLARGHVRACECMSLSQVHQLMCVSASVFSGMRAAAEEFEAQGCPERPCHASPGLPSLPPSLQNTCGGVTSKRASSIHTHTKRTPNAYEHHARVVQLCMLVCMHARYRRAWFQWSHHSSLSPSLPLPILTTPLNRALHVRFLYSSRRTMAAARVTPEQPPLKAASVLARAYDAM